MFWTCVFSAYKSMTSNLNFTPVDILSCLIARMKSITEGS